MEKKLQKLISDWEQVAEEEKQYLKECQMKEGRLIHSGEYRRLRKCILEVRKILKTGREQQPL